MAKGDRIAIIRHLAKETGLPQYLVRAVLIGLVRLIVTELAFGRTVEIISLGKFYTQIKEASLIWHPQKKEKILIEKRIIPKFKFSKRLYDYIRQEANKKLRRGRNKNFGQDVS